MKNSCGHDKIEWTQPNEPKERNEYTKYDSRYREKTEKKIKELEEERARILDLRVFYGEQGYKGSADKLLVKANALRDVIIELQRR